MKFIMYEPYSIFSEYNAEVSYLQSLVASILQASDCELVQVSPPSSNNNFMRDHFVLLERDYVLIKSKKIHGVDAILSKIMPALPRDYQTLTIDSSFVGGNILRVNYGELSTLFYGDYNEESWSQSKEDFYAFFLKAKPTTNSPEKFIGELNAKKTSGQLPLLTNTIFKTLAVNNTIKRDREIFDDFYYHLDCFMTFIPNGKIIILNKKMLQDIAFINLLEAVGEDNIIDLAYELYLEVPLIFNPIVIPLHNNKFILFCPTLPETLICKLESFGYYVITPASLNSSHFRFNAELAEHVNQSLKAMGWCTEINTLVSEIPSFRANYNLTNIKLILSMLASKINITTIVDKLDQAQEPFTRITKNEALLLLSIPFQSIKHGSEKEKIKQCLKLLCVYNENIMFDFTEFDKSSELPETISFKTSRKKADISFTANKGSVHCLTQECPIQPSENRMVFYSPAQPLFIPRNDFVLLKKYQLSKEKFFPNMDTVLRRAAGEGNIDDVINSIERGADVNSQSSSNGYTALHWACHFGYVYIIQCLIQRGANHNIMSKTPIQKTPFELIPSDRKDLTALFHQAETAVLQKLM